jgi:hypothetical protein
MKVSWFSRWLVKSESGQKAEIAKKNKAEAIGQAASVHTILHKYPLHLSFIQWIQQLITAQLYTKFPDGRLAIKFHTGGRSSGTHELSSIEPPV